MSDIYNIHVVNGDNKLEHSTRAKDKDLTVIMDALRILFHPQLSEDNWSIGFTYSHNEQTVKQLSEGC